MAGETPLTLVGNLVSDPELRFTPSGAAVANFTVASTPRTFDKQTSEWKDGETVFMRCSIWREAAENVAESLTRGTRVVVSGRLVSRSWETDNGEKRTVMEMQADEVGPSLKYATASVTKAQRSGGGGGNSGGGGFGGGNQNNNQGDGKAMRGKPDNDPWSTGGGAGGGNSGQSNSGNQGSRSSGGGGGWGGGPSYDEPPF